MSNVKSTKQVIGVDLDNVLARTDDKVRELITVYFGVKSSQSQITRWNYHENLPISKEQEAFIFDEFHGHHLLEVQPVEGARREMFALSRSNQLWIVTQRPHYTELDTGLWLCRNEIPYDKLVFSINKADIADQLRVLIDDNPETAFAVARKGTQVFLFDYPWNRYVGESEGITRIYNWPQITARLEPRELVRYSG